MLWWFRDRLGHDVNGATDEAFLLSSFAELGADSLDVVELVMELEEEFDFDIPDNVAERLKTVGDAVRYILNARRQSPT